ncbi:nitrate regulatory gene2 protein-like [Juglans microcarpa x Juglans regia]|uniref:nitrate regulatory gene2 protein-like n=1 Tax=Juglans microcarpa x Juglans regia TaxID=2249226 RepID=UPI001B7DE909|nr:nitrate regulatory gene2 protein-like [Juglans microcarpa x Juglans regia]
MGCSTSKVDDLPAVALCRDRMTYLDEAIHQRYALAEAHLAYIRSLKGIGRSLHGFIDDLTHSVALPVSPELNLPPHRKGDPVHHRRDDSGHIDFNSGSDSDDDDLGSLHHDSGHSSPLHQHGDIEYMDTDQFEDGNGQLGSYQFQGFFPGDRGERGGGGGLMHMNYMKNKATPSVVYEQRPVSSEKVYMGESSPAYSAYPHSYYGNTNPSSSASAYYGSASPPNPNYSNYGSGYYTNSPSQMDTSSKKPPPPPPSPPQASAWDFLNPFEGYDRYYAAYTPSRNSKDLREEEGIPDLEDEDYQHEVVKEVHGEEKFVADGGRSGGDGSGMRSKAVVDDIEASTSLYEIRPSSAIENDRMGYDGHTVEKKVVDNQERSEETRARFKGPLSVSQVVQEVEVQFDRASESGNEVARMLEVGKLPYNRKHGVYQVSSKMLHVAPSMPMVSAQPSTSKGAESSSASDKAGPAQLYVDEDVVWLGSTNLSSTLQKLYLWEKKLYNEVKAEEKMRVDHDRKVDKLKRLDKRGAEAHKVDATRTLIRSLSTRIRMAIQVVDKISVTINKIRDEELWPQLNELIQGLTRMWKSMLECHRSQCQAIREAKGLGLIGSGKKLSDDHSRATSELVHELIRWNVAFCHWISCQKGYVRALNNWLLRCILYEPEETDDGVAPFSPSRVGAPPVFVICNQWSQTLERISEKEVVVSMRGFTMSVVHIWDQDMLEMRQMGMANKDLEKKVKNLEREDQKIQKEIQALDKNLLVYGDGNSLSVGEVVYPSDTHNRSLQASLQLIFEAMERFTANSMRAYEELLQRSEEERVRQEHGSVSQG